MTWYLSYLLTTFSLKVSKKLTSHLSDVLIGSYLISKNSYCLAQGLCSCKLLWVYVFLQVFASQSIQILYSLSSLLFSCISGVNKLPGAKARMVWLVFTTMYLGITFYAVPKFMMLTDRNVTSSLCPVFFGYFIDFHHIIFSFLFFSRLITVFPLRITNNVMIW